MTMRAICLSAATGALLAVAAPSHAQSCQASAKLIETKKVLNASDTAPPRKAGAAAQNTPRTWELHFNVQASGCPDFAGHPNKFAKAAYGTITYTFHKNYRNLHPPVEKDDKGTATWNDASKEVSVVANLVSQDADGTIFEASNPQVARVDCGCH
jgi:hypothetical protein